MEERADLTSAVEGIDTEEEAVFLLRNEGGGALYLFEGPRSEKGRTKKGYHCQ